MHTGGTRISLEHLYKIARLKKKKARRLFDNNVASKSAAPKDSATMMSSIMDSDGYTTVSHRGGSPTASPPKLQSQSRSPLCQRFKSGTRRNPFVDKFLGTFHPMFANGSTNKNAPIGTELALLTKFPLSPENVEPDVVVGTIVTTLVSDGVADGERTYDELVTRASSWSNVGVDVRSTVPALGANGTGANEVTRKLGAKNVNNKSLSLSAVAPSRIELDLDAYVNDPDSCQPTKKALCGNQILLVTAARSASTSASPIRFSLYSNKRNPISSPAKGRSASRNSNLPSCGNLLHRVT